MKPNKLIQEPFAITELPRHDFSGIASNVQAFPK
jgi:hypothetical protein